MGKTRGNKVVTAEPKVQGKVEEKVEELLPGIPNELTLDHICTKLSWRAFYMLSTVSPTWRHAVQSRRIFEARVRFYSTDTLVVHSHPFGRELECEGLNIYSGREKRCYNLQELPGLDKGIPWECRCVSLDGKLYVLGGWTHPDDREDIPPDERRGVYKEVYVLDLVEREPRKANWKQCASMKEGRHKFGCGVIEGKIYVFGGASESGPVHGSEVYDPQLDSWTSIAPMSSFRFEHQVAAVGDVLVIYGGKFYDLDSESRKPNSPAEDDRVHEALFMEAYHPAKDEWRVVAPFRKADSETVFVTEGKFHLMTQSGVYIQDPESNSWKDLHSNSFPWNRRRSLRGDSAYYTVLPDAAVVVDHGELFVGANWYSNFSSGDSGILQGKGFGSESPEIIWDQVECVMARMPRAPLWCRPKKEKKIGCLKENGGSGEDAEEKEEAEEEVNGYFAELKCSIQL